MYDVYSCMLCPSLVRRPKIIFFINNRYLIGLDY